MVQQSTLLQILQFVGLITPALAILMELLVRFHGGLEHLQENRKLPIEIQVLFLGFSAILIGGMGIGLQMILGLDDPVTQFAGILIFGGLPFLALSMLAIHVRISVISSPDASIIEGFQVGIRRASSVGLPLIFTILLYYYPIYYFREEINSSIAWWIFQGTIEPIWYLYIVSSIFLYKVMYSLWSHESIPGDDLGRSINDWFVVSFTVAAFFVVLSGPVFILYFGLLQLNVPMISSASLLSAIPYLWGIIIVLAALYSEVDPDSD